MSPRTRRSKGGSDRRTASPGAEWLGTVAVAASMVFWTIYAVLPVDLAWSSTASSAAHLR